MGSELVDIEAGIVLWGLSPKSYANLWAGDSPWKSLAVSDKELNGKTDRIKATRLLTAPAFAPMLRGIEPYSRLVAGIGTIVAHRDAVRSFPYDWRLSVRHNAKQLAALADQHLSSWRAHPSGSRDAKLTLVAHSMGGVVARYFTEALGGHAEVRQTITIGTPFQGAVKAVFLLAQGQGGPLPLPRQRLITLARTLPSVYDLLPTYRCFEEGGAMRKLTPVDIGDMGGDVHMASDAMALREAYAAANRSELRTMVGVEQPTMQSLRMQDGIAEAQYYLHEDDGLVDWRGDGTVYSQVAAGGVEPIANLPQSHGALARTPEAIAAIRAVLTRRRLGPPMGNAEVSLEVPESVVAGEQFEISVSSTGDARRTRCRIVDADTDIPVAEPLLIRRSSALVGSAQLSKTGLYRIEAKGGGFSAVSQLTMVVPHNAYDDCKYNE